MSPEHAQGWIRAGVALDTPHSLQVTVLRLCGSSDFVPMVQRGFAVLWWSFRSRDTGAALASAPGGALGHCAVHAGSVRSCAVVVVLSPIPPLHRLVLLLPLSWQRYENTLQTKSFVFISICQWLLRLPPNSSLFPLVGISVGQVIVVISLHHIFDHYSMV